MGYSCADKFGGFAGTEVDFGEIIPHFVPCVAFRQEIANPELPRRIESPALQ
jgi:hypothetical protein